MFGTRTRSASATASAMALKRPSPSEGHFFRSRRSPASLQIRDCSPSPPRGRWRQASAQACSFGSEEVECEGLRFRPGTGSKPSSMGRCRPNTGDRPTDPRLRKSLAQAHDRSFCTYTSAGPRLHCCDGSVAAEPGRQPDPTAQDRATTLGPRQGGANEPDFDRLVRTVVGTLG